MELLRIYVAYQSWLSRASCASLYISNGMDESRHFLPPLCPPSKLESHRENLLFSSSSSHESSKVVPSVVEENHDQSHKHQRKVGVNPRSHRRRALTGLQGLAPSTDHSW